MQILESDPFKWLPSLDKAIKTFYDRVPTPNDLPTPEPVVMNESALQWNDGQ